MADGTQNIELEQAIAMVRKIAEGIGFDTIGQVATDALVTRPEVRDMCAANTCRHYDRNWCCPPACGPISEYQEQINARSVAVLVQTVGQMEDSFDFETMMETAETHDERFTQLLFSVRDAFAGEPKTDAGPAVSSASGISPFFLGAGTCTICPTCAYPDEPCRFPDRSFVSMEAGGLVVSEVCTAAGIPYNHGQNTIAYTGCVML